MDAIHDLSWMQHLLYGTTIEKFDWQGYSVVSLAVPATDRRHFTQYPFRMLFFETGTNRPCCAINCEHTILESYCLSSQEGNAHTVFLRLDGPITYDRFRALALERAGTLLPAARVPRTRAGSPRPRRKAHGS